MRVLLKSVAYVGLILGIAVFAYRFSAEQDKVHNSAPDASKSQVIAYFGACVGAAIALGLCIAYDVTQFLGNRATRFMMFGGREPVSAPELDRAERLRKRDALEAIRVLREYLEKRPDEVEVMLRVADIYERDLGNLLAAALEVEAFLERKVDPERWGWSAIHLSNLYVRLRRPDKAAEWLRRVDRECARTSAASKARKRLAQFE
jgi:hypothetical protein